MNVYHRPDALSEALEIAASGGAVIAAGCTDLFPATDAPALSGSVLDLTAVTGLRGIERMRDGGWRIGATTTWADVLAADLPPAFDGLKQAAAEVGSRQIQAAGTVGGNLCNASPAADGVPPLLTLDASVELTSSAGRREMPLAQFLTGPRSTARAPGEVLTAVLVPDMQGRGIFSKLGARRYLVISIAMVAARIVAADGRIANAALSVGACGPVATRLPAQEAALAGVPLAEAAQRLSPDLLAPDLSPIGDVRADAEYRTRAAVELLRRAVADLAGAAP